MMVIFTSRSEKKAIYTVRRILDSLQTELGMIRGKRSLRKRDC